MDATQNLDDEDVVKLVADREEVLENDDDTDANVDRVPTASKVIDVFDLLSRFAGSQEGGKEAVIPLVSYESCVTLLLPQGMAVHARVSPMIVQREYAD
ncbi:hypothetical protein HPB49_023150 [Dermacentor silvarum]|uniref:Uncharacterized protein n=1 Tax=Dermacentor silvarum TaxID=543639 RepID=A0ACB8DGH4_DERSI|nr:hypothetical protein HPB49_023150 [Dermacentor silvarum]